MAEAETTKKAEDFNIYVGGKPLMNYVTAAVMQFTQGASKIIIKSRGKFIWRAVDVAEVVRKRFLKEQVDIENIKIDSEGFRNKDGRDIRVSTMEIILTKK